MLDRVRWTAAEKPQRRLQTEINFSVRLGEVENGNVFEQTLRSQFPRGFTRKDARWLLEQTVTAASKAILKSGRGNFPLKVVMLRGDARNITLTDRTEELA